MSSRIVQNIDEIITVPRVLKFEYYPEVEINRLRNTIITNGSSSVVGGVGSPELTISTTASGTDSASVNSKEVVRYNEGAVVIVIVSARITTGLPSGNAFFFIGTTDTSLQDGYVWEIRSDGLHIVQYKGGVQQRDIPQASFNVDSLLDGTGSTRINYNISNLEYYAIRINSRVGSIQFGFMGRTESQGFNRFISVHEIENYTGFPTNAQNFTSRPICYGIDNNGTAVANSMGITNHRIELEGHLVDTNRITSIYRSGNVFKVINTGTFVPVISVRKKTGYCHIDVDLHSIDLISENHLMVGIFVNSSLTGASWTSILNTDSDETVLEYDESATAMTTSSTPGDGLIALYTGFVSGGSTNSGRVKFLENLETYMMKLCVNDTLTIGARDLGSNSNLYVILKMKERW